MCVDGGAGRKFQVVCNLPKHYIIVEEIFGQIDREFSDVANDEDLNTKLNAMTMPWYPYPLDILLISLPGFLFFAALGALTGEPLGSTSRK